MPQPLPVSLICPAGVHRAALWAILPEETLADFQDDTTLIRSMHRTASQDIEALWARGVSICHSTVPERELPLRSGKEVASHLTTPYLLCYRIADQIWKLRFGSHAVHYATMHILQPEEIASTLALPRLDVIRDWVLLLDPLRMQARPILGPRFVGERAIEYVLPQGYPWEAVAGELKVSVFQTLLGDERVHPPLTFSNHATTKNRDIFICHASEDKLPVVEPLIAALEGSGVSCWYDKYEIQWGNAITRTINEALFLARFVLVVVSATSLSKTWPLRELEAVLARDINEGTNRILPLIYGSWSTYEAWTQRFPLLRDIVYLRWDGDPKPIVQSLLAKLGSTPP